MPRPGQQPPISYRTVPGRHRTQKWQAASKQTYDGDDWGAYDPYDEYGGGYGEEEEEQPPPIPQQFSAGPPQQQGRPPRRVNSFDQGDEGRLFSTASGPSAGPASSVPFPAYDTRAHPPTAPNNSRPSNEDLRSKGRPRDFTNPEHVPPPLSTRVDPAPAEWFPPRKSSLSRGSPADAHLVAPADSLPVSETATAASAGVEKPLPFIRPSDIYKRIPEERERERQSEESSRPSMDSLQREMDAPVQSNLAAGPRTNLATVAESRESRLFMDEPGSAQVTESKGQFPPTTTGTNVTTDLQHQPSQGLRSAVQQAFDRADDGSSRDGSQTNSESVTRSNTTSTGAISPIMSNVPFPASMQQVPPIAEVAGLASQSHQSVQRKPSPRPPPDFEPGYRRSLDPPSTEQSPARTPAVEDVAAKRLSSPMTAETMAVADAPDVPDQAAEIPEPTLQSVETPSTGPIPITNQTFPVTGRGRSNTDYSIREADLANTVNASPPDNGGLADTVAEAKASQDLFLSTHATTPSTPLGANTAGTVGTSRTGTPTNAGPGSPSKGRVREIADQYQEIHNASRRNSAGSIGSNKSRQATNSVTSERDTVGNSASLQDARPAIDREQSFQPDLPGGWISSAPTPVGERPLGPAEDNGPTSPTTPRVEVQSNREEPVDLTPTTRKFQLQEVPANDTSSSASSAQAPFDAVKQAGDQLGAALLTNVGLGHQTRDFASSEPAEPVEQPQSQASIRAGPVSTLPPMLRQETGSSDAPTSIASSKPPTPLPKDTPKGETTDPNGSSSEHLASDYFPSTVPPLRLSSRQGRAEPLDRAAEQPRTAAVNTLSSYSGVDETESDRLRKEIVRSLDDAQHDRKDRAERTQDAFEASESDRTAEQVTASHPVAESTTRPDFLSQRFSWETPEPIQKTAADAPLPPVPTIAKPPEPESPEIKPERAYERPRSSVLQVVNADSDDVVSPDESIPELREPESVDLTVRTDIENTISEENTLRPVAADIGSESPSSFTKELAPGSFSERTGSVDSGPRLPSYYLGNDQPDALLEPPEKDHTTSSSMSHSVSEEPAKSKAGPIPTFRNILAMKSSGERIRTYNDTRQTFAEMNTGLSNWLVTMFENHPEHADVATGRPLALQTSGVGTFKRNHKPSPSIIKFTKQFGENQRSASGGSVGEAGAAAPQRRTSIPGNDRLDMDKMQQRGKDLMKSAGVFGGKAQAGAKGLFAKGKSRFGTRRDSDKVFPPPKTASATVMSSPLPPPDLPISNNATSLRGGAASTPPSSASASPKPQAAETYLALRPTMSLNSHSRTSSASHDTASSSRHRTHLSQTLSLFRTRSSSKSKSKSKSPAPGSSQINPESRPTSLVISNRDPSLRQQGFMLEEPIEESDFRRPNTSSSTGGSTSEASKLRKEAWEDDNDGNSNAPGKPDVGPIQSRTIASPSLLSRRGGPQANLAIPKLGEFDTLGDRQRHLERLGVLPSPAETMRTFDFGTPVQQQSSPTSLRRSRGGRGGDEDANTSSPIAKRERKGSDLALLPSQQRRRQSEAEQGGKQKREERSSQEDEEDEVYLASPITVQTVQPVLVVRGGKKEEEDEREDLYGATPVTPRKPAIPFSRGEDREKEASPKLVQEKEVVIPDSSISAEGSTSVPQEDLKITEPDAFPSTQETSLKSETVLHQTPTNDEPSPEQTVSDPLGAKADPDIQHGSRRQSWDDTRSEISAEDVAHPNEPLRRESAVSRRSSVSSLGGPDLAIATSGIGFGAHNDADEIPIMSAQAVPAGPIGPSSPTSPATHGRSLEESMQSPGPRPMASQEALVYRERFANRPYQRHPDAERPLSFVPLPRDSTGDPPQEMLPPSERQLETGVYPSPPLDSPISFQPNPVVRPPIVAVQPTEYERLRTTPAQPIEPDDVPRPALREDVSSRRSKPLSGLLRRNRPANETVPPAAPAIAPVRAESPSVGLHARPPHEDSHGRRRSAVLDAIMAVRRPSVAERGNASRRSSVINMLPGSGSATPRATAANMIDKNDVPRSRPSTLRKPQRSASTASSNDTEPKKKRFSGFGQLFGRSSTTGHGTPKPSRLSKVPPERENTGRENGQQPVGGPNRETGNTVAGSVRGYEAFEALRQQEVPAFQENSTRYPSVSAPRSPSPRREPRLPNLQSMPEESAMPPAGGWYGPANSGTPVTPADPASASSGAPSSQLRRGPLSGGRSNIPYSTIPEAFRPTQASFNAPVNPIGPPLEHQPPIQESLRSTAPAPSSVLPYQQPSYTNPPPPVMMDPPRQRQASYGTAVDLPPQRQTSYVPEVPQFPRRSSGLSNAELRAASISPVQARNGYDFPLQRDYRSTSIGQEYAHSPPRHHDDPPPWSPAQEQEPEDTIWQYARPPRGTAPPGWQPRAQDQLPRTEEQYRPSGQFSPRIPSHPTMHQPSSYQPRPSFPYTPVTPSAASQTYPYPSPLSPRQAQAMPPPQPFARNFDMGSSGYASPPYSPDAPAQYPPYDPPAHYQQHHHHQRAPQLRQPAPPLPSGMHAYTQGPLVPPPLVQRKPLAAATFPGPPPHHGGGSFTGMPRQRQYSGDATMMNAPASAFPPSRVLSSSARPRAPSSSGFTGRRDDPAAGEDELQMRGASYPGQEWTPSGLSGGDWD